MQTEALSNRRIASTLTIALVPIFLGVLIYGYWLNEYFNNFNISPRDGIIPTVGFALLVIAVPANILGFIFLYIPWKKNKAEIQGSSSLKRKYFGLFSLLLLNYFVAGGILYNYNWLNSTVSIEFTNNYNEPLKDLMVVLPNGDGIHVNYVKPGYSSNIRVFNKGEGAVEFIAVDTQDQRAREVVLGYVTSNMGGRAKVTLEKDFSLSIFTNHPSKPE